MLGSIELLSLTRLEPRQRDQLAVMQHASQSLIDIINDVLDFSKIEAGQMSLQPRPCRLDEVIEEVTRGFAAEAARKHLRLLCIIDPSLSEPVMADVVKLEQILNNLVSNAVKFTEQGKVIVAARRMRSAQGGGAEGVEIRVVDNRPLHSSSSACAASAWPISTRSSMPTFARAANGCVAGATQTACTA
ncbi:hypothetical protein MKD38_04365 [Cupriavidus sp. WGlv3]|nr:hypothetical protein [Cupriavidus sp. WGlv3]